MTREDVVVIGGGVIGVCAAHFLSERGRAVTLLEQGEIAAGSSYGNAGLIVPSLSVPLAAPGALGSGLRWMLDPESPFYIRPRLDPDLALWLLRFALACRPGCVRQAVPVLRDLGRASLALYEALARLEGLDCGYRRAGLLTLFRTRRGLADGRHEAELLEQHGLSPGVLDADGVRQIEPNVQPEVIGGVFFQQDAHLDPARFVRGLACLLAGRGVRLRTGSEVLGFDVSRRRVARIHTTRGDIEPREVVLAAGAWSPRLARNLGLKLPIQAGKGYSITVRRPARCPALPLMLGEAHVAVTPLGEVMRLAGTLEMTGLDLAINARRVAALRRALPAYLAGMDDLAPVEIWRGLRPRSPEGLPIVGRPRACHNVTIASGHAMVGMSLGPITGKLVAQLVCGEHPDLDLRPLRPERF